MYIVDFCVWYDHDCGYDPNKETIEHPTGFLDLWPITGKVYENSCPGHGECRYGEIETSGYQLFKDRFEARQYYKKIRREIKENPGIYGEITINYVTEDSGVIHGPKSLSHYRIRVND